MLSAANPLGLLTKVKDPGAPLAEAKGPLCGDCGLPTALGFCPARQPTTARTAPPLLPSRFEGRTTTSVTMFAKKQVAFATFVQPVGRPTLRKLRPASAER